MTVCTKKLSQKIQQIGRISSAPTSKCVTPKKLPDLAGEIEQQNLTSKSCSKGYKDGERSDGKTEWECFD
ncbi:MAG: hypothetical protein NZ805_13125 [Armatimonadetes bacterium]|nr:hypothetical protein [Armatimonadota bacterium]MDW8028616.1 hypothetical protein [Armatimonadota bacterium]